MCLPAGPAGAALGMQAAGLAISAVSTVASMAQAQASMQMQANQYEQQMNLQYQQAQQQAALQNRQIQQQHMGQVRQEIAANQAYQQQLQNNNTAANKTYTQEQAKLNEARAQAAFKAQTNYAKAIGSQGKVLASGATGQSVGLLMLDAERQAGFGTAAESAKLESKAAQAGTQMDIVQDQAQSSINNAYSRLIPPTAAAQLEAMPVGMGKDLNLGIPEYNWS